MSGASSNNTNPTDPAAEPADRIDDAMNRRLQAVNTSLLEGLGQLASYFGFSKIIGQLFGVLLLSPEPLSLDDLMSRLGISKASVSTNLRTMEHMGIVREAWVKDDRRKYYRAENDLWRVLTNILGSRELRDVNQALRVLAENRQELAQGLDDLSDEERQLTEFYLERLERLEEFFQLAHLLLTTFIQHVQEQQDVSEIKIDFE